MLGADASEVPAIREDIAHLGRGESGGSYRAYLRALLRLRPLAREGGWAGYRAPENDRERQTLALARRELRRTSWQVGTVPALEAHRGLLAALACDLDTARRHLERASAESESRETLFGRAEVQLREGDRDSVESFLTAARQMPGAVQDAWINALAASLDAPPSCP